MARRLRPLLYQDLARLPSVCTGCVFWESAEKHDRRCGSACDAEVLRAWYERVTDEWGDCGRVLLGDEGEIIGFIKYAPSGYFPQAHTFASRPTDPDIVLITCLHIDDNAREYNYGRLLVQAALKDLKSRGERSVQSFACAERCELNVMPMIGMDYLLSQGFAVVRADPSFPLLQLDLRSLAMLAENLESLLDSLRVTWRAPVRVPEPNPRARLR
jgi:ribosomal protein S18 acetylase RimI-like enzyme